MQTMPVSWRARDAAAFAAAWKLSCCEAETSRSKESKEYAPQALSWRSVAASLAQRRLPSSKVSHLASMGVSGRLGLAMELFCRTRAPSDRRWR